MPTREPKDTGLDDLPPKEQTPDQAGQVKGGYEPPDGGELRAIPLPYDPPNG